MLRLLRNGTATLMICVLSACGTTYVVPEASDETAQKAARMFAEERNPATARAGGQKSPAAAARQFVEVARRIEPVAERFCAQETAEHEGFDCDVRIVLDDRMPFRNAYQTYAPDGTPIVAFTLPMVADARNADEIAFVLGHEFGHHIARHIEKAQQQAAAGALLMGGLMAVATAQSAGSPYYSQYQAQQDVQNAAELGFALGRRAYSHEYELEADVIGTYIAKTAGYDPVRGARFFARPEPQRKSDGSLSFWGTHPPDEDRLATVIEVSTALDRGQGLLRAE